jgi:high-affinity nickel-transport protein
LTITGLSVFVAFFIGTIELLGLIGQEANLNDPFFNFFQNFNINTAGFVIVGAFVLTWVVALLYWHYGHIEDKWDQNMLKAQSASGGPMAPPEIPWELKRDS